MYSGLSKAIKDEITDVKNDVQKAVRGVAEMQESQKGKESQFH